jgi:hypothetical protein
MKFSEMRRPETPERRARIDAIKGDMGAAEKAEAMIRWTHRHHWQGVGILPGVYVALRQEATVIQSCECGDVRRVEVP